MKKNIVVYLSGLILLSGCGISSDSYMSNSQDIDNIIKTQTWHELDLPQGLIIQQNEINKINTNSEKVKSYISNVKQTEHGREYWALTNTLVNNIVLGRVLVQNEVDCKDKDNDKTLKSYTKIDTSSLDGSPAIIVKTGEGYNNIAGYVNGSVYIKGKGRNDMSYFYSPIEQRNKMTKEQISYYENLRNDVCSMKL